jgi:hypothetical protein
VREGRAQTRSPPLDRDDAQHEPERRSVERLNDHDPVGQPLMVELSPDLDRRTTRAPTPVSAVIIEWIEETEQTPHPREPLTSL